MAHHRTLSSASGKNVWDTPTSSYQTPRPITRSNTNKFQNEEEAAAAAAATTTTTTTTSEEREREKDADLRQELASVRKVNETIEGVIASLQRAQGNIKSVNQTVTAASSLLNTWTRILSQTEHNQRLILDPSWQGASQDLADIEAEAAAAAAAAKQQQQRREAAEEQERKSAATAAAAAAAAAGLADDDALGVGSARSGGAGTGVGVRVPRARGVAGRGRGVGGVGGSRSVSGGTSTSGGNFGRRGGGTGYLAGRTGSGVPAARSVSNSSGTTRRTPASGVGRARGVGARGGRT